jgi:hypothetical protein
MRGVIKNIISLSLRERAGVRVAGVRRALTLTLSQRERGSRKDIE